MKKWLLILLLSLTGFANAAIELGKDYTVLANPQPVANPKKIEVIEFFSYHCPHCYTLDPFMAAWEKTKPADVDFRKEQIVWQKQMEGLARMFAAFNATGTIDKLHRPAFTAMLQSHLNMADEAVFTKWLKQQKGVDTAKVLAAYKSFAVNAQVARASKMTRDYAIQSTPTIVVNGKYALAAAAPERLIQVLNELIAKIRAEKK
ncbi:thiol:disulfide interchange protein DsbA/DsbL [Neisseriaceae bacterium TC5R-5]|nr:thiol:disulfide interchange protein DsbA/DsbL [Neisseriaceae bacterium TC5R-5]